MALMALMARAPRTVALLAECESEVMPRATWPGGQHVRFLRML